MKVYVDELPIKVRQSVIHYDDGKTNCLILEFSEGIEPSEICETKALKQQVRKEVCMDVREKVIDLIERKGYKSGSLCNFEYANGYCYGLQYDLVKILDQIQGEI